MEKTLEPSSLDKIRFYDCDPFGHLNNSRYIDYIMNARENHLSSFYSMNLDDYYRKGIGWVVSHHEIAYLKSTRFNETVCIQTSLIAGTENQIMVEGIMFDEFKTAIKAILWTKFTSIDLKTGKKQNHSADLMEFVKMALNTGIDITGGLSKRIQDFYEKMKSR